MLMKKSLLTAFAIAALTTTVLTPAFAQSRIAPGTPSAGSAITARSTFAGTSRIDGKLRSP